VTLSVVLILVGGLGIVILLVMAVVKPGGTLAATFELRGPILA
jgi:hypothetical protein